VLQKPGAPFALRDQICTKMQICNIRCFNERLRLEWSSIAMATEPSNQQNALMFNDLQYINAILSTVHGGGVQSPESNRGEGAPVVEPSETFWAIHYRNPGKRCETQTSFKVKILLNHL
jgi:hypothetical protein